MPYARWLLIAAVVAVGLVITPHYGESWDERQFYKYADSALGAYSTWPQSGFVPLTGNTYDNYGPAYVMFTALAARLLGNVLPWSISDLRHLVYFFTFVVGLWALYGLSRRWLGRTAALGVTLLFGTQPVIWGHAFISPKDIPFLAFVILTLLLGFGWVDRMAGEPDGSAPAAPRQLILLTGIWLVLVLASILITPVVHAWIDSLVRAAAAGQQNIIAGLASDIRTADPGIYVVKYFVLFLRLRAVWIIGSTVVVGFIWRRIPGSLRFLASIAPAGLVMGFATSIRVLGPLAGLIVAAYAVRRLGRQALVPLLVYGLLGLFAMYVTWPYLWPDPLGHLVESVRVMSQYPWKGNVLFDGIQYASTELPRSYLPVLLAIQLTETAWLSILVGAVIGLLAVLRQRGGYAIPLLALVWFVLPFLGFVITRAPLYDNFRQVLFILPPLFMLAGPAFEAIPRRYIQIALITLTILPGVIAGMRLHPYEYIYYNRFIGGVHGAFRRFELDYWGTSFREAAAYLDEAAPPNATIWVEGPTHLLQAYARPDLKIYSTYESERASRYDYIVALTRFDLDLQAYPDAPIDHVVERDGALLSVIKKP